MFKGEKRLVLGVLSFYVGMLTGSDPIVDEILVRIDPVGCHNAAGHKIHDRQEQKRLVGSAVHGGGREYVPVFIGI